MHMESCLQAISSLCSCICPRRKATLEYGVGVGFVPKFPN